LRNGGVNPRGSKSTVPIFSLGKKKSEKITVWGPLPGGSRCGKKQNLGELLSEHSGGEKKEGSGKKKQTPSDLNGRAEKSGGLFSDSLGGTKKKRLGYAPALEYNNYLAAFGLPGRNRKTEVKCPACFDAQQH